LTGEQTTSVRSGERSRHGPLLAEFSRHTLAAGWKRWVRGNLSISHRSSQGRRLEGIALGCPLRRATEQFHWVLRSSNHMLRSRAQGRNLVLMTCKLSGNTAAPNLSGCCPAAMAGPAQREQSGVKQGKPGRGGRFIIVPFGRYLWLFTLQRPDAEWHGPNVARPPKIEQCRCRRTSGIPASQYGHRVW